MTRRSPGFTLVEVVLVVALLALLAALAMPKVSESLDLARLKDASSSVRSALARAREAAVSTQSGNAVFFRAEEGEYQMAGDPSPKTLPEGVRMEVFPGEDDAPAREVLVRFYPDGSSDEVRVVLKTQAGRSEAVETDPYTGLAETAAPPS